MGIRISAVVCTHNRAPYLIKALQSLDQQTLDSDMYEVLVVDNASTDNTREVFSNYSNRSNWRYIFEPVLGLSRARNTGWRDAQGKYVAFMDDDAIANPDWLAKFLEAFDTFKPEPGSVGGRCFPIWEAPQPKWLSNKMLSSLSIYHYGDKPTIMNERQGLSACNIAYPKQLLQSVGGFREDLGRKGPLLLAGEEIYLRQQLEALGHYSVYFPEILVSHHIPGSRLTKRWFRQDAYWKGKSRALISTRDNQSISIISRLKLTLKNIGWALPRVGLLLISTNSADRFRRQCQLFEVIGYVSGLYR